MSYRWIRVSEINNYAYCQRAWWLRRFRRVSSENVRELEAGQRFHQEHGHLLHRSVWAQYAAYFLLFIVVAIVTFQILSGM
ncbi:MAG: hypothetical protein ACE5E7_10505 [Anaerolineae bacterium]